MRKQLSFLLLTTSLAHAESTKLAADFGYFSLSANANGETASISNPSAFRFSYLRELTPKLELNLSYSIILADFSGSDLGFGPDLGLNYYLLSDGGDHIYRDEKFHVRVSDLWKPYIGVAFSQRNFQSVKNSYAGVGFSAGTEMYYNEKINFRVEARYISLAGTGESEAKEMGLFFGLVYKR